jgi:predicted ester cyclase
MSTEHNIQLVLRWKEELWRNRNVSIIDELCTPDFICHMSGVPVPGPVPGKEALRQLLASYFAAFEIRDTSEFLLAEGDLVAIHDTYRLKHTGAIEGIPPTGKEATMTGTDIYRIVDGKIVEQWVEVDRLGLMHQLGLLPTPGQGGS